MGRGDSGRISEENNRIRASANVDGVLDAGRGCDWMGDGRNRQTSRRHAFDMARDYFASNRRSGGQPKPTAVLARCLCPFRQSSSGTLLVARRSRYRRVQDFRLQVSRVRFFVAALPVAPDHRRMAIERGLRGWRDRIDPERLGGRGRFCPRTRGQTAKTFCPQLL